MTRPGFRGGMGPRPNGGAPSFPAHPGAGARPDHHGPDGRFRNPWPDAELRTARQMLRWGMERVMHGVPDDPDLSVFPTAQPRVPDRPDPADVVVTWIGHAATLVQIAGRNVLTDPMFGARASPMPFAGPRRWVPPGVPLDRIPGVDTVVLSHNHYDHLDAGSVRAIARRWPEAEWHVPLRLGVLIRSLGVGRIVERDWWEGGASGPLQVTATPAQHFSARTPFDRDRTLWCGWVIAGAGRRVFFAGDTGYHPVFPEIARRLGPFDLVLLPIGAYEPRWFMRPAHMNPEEAVRAFGDVQAAGDGAVLVPVHWGTFKLTDEPMDEPPRRVRVAWQASGRPADRLWLLSHGETRTLPRVRT